VPENLVRRNKPPKAPKSKAAIRAYPSDPSGARRTEKSKPGDWPLRVISTEPFLGRPMRISWEMS